MPRVPALVLMFLALAATAVPRSLAATADYASPSPATPTPTVVASPTPSPAKAPTTNKPVSAAAPGRNVKTWMEKSPLLNLTLAVFSAAGLNGVTANNAYVGTFFLPTNAAWSAFLAKTGLTMAQLTSNFVLVEKLAKGSIVPFVSVRTLDMFQGMKLATLNQAALTIRPELTQYVVVSGWNSATIVIPDLVADHSIVHLVDTVLIPDSVRLTPSR